MKNSEIVNKLIKGETASITDSLQFAQVRKELRSIKKNCTIVLSQIKNQ